MRGSLPERVHDAVEVILRDRACGTGSHTVSSLKTTRAVDDRRDLAVAAAEIEADPAAIQVAAERPGDRAFRRQFARGDDLDADDRKPALPTKSASNRPGGCRDIVRRERGGQFRRSVDVNPPAAPRPEQKLDEPFDVRVVRRGMRMRGRQYRRFEMEDRAIGLFESEPHRQPARRWRRRAVRTRAWRARRGEIRDRGPRARAGREEGSH